MGAVNIGTLQGVLTMRDEFTAHMDRFEKRLKAIEDSTDRTSRKTKSETDKIGEAYRKVAASLDPVVARTQKYEQRVETLNKALAAGVITQSQYNAQLAKAQAHLQPTVHWTDKLSGSIRGELIGSFTRFIGVAALVTVSLTAITTLTKQYVTANIEAEASERRVEAAIRRHGTASGVTAEQINATADSLSHLTGIDDELIADAQTLALRFNRLSADILPEVTATALDMSQSLGIDLSSAMEKVGKIVNQPLRALTLLNREGYAVGKSQSDLIKSLLRSNDLFGAQNEVLKILKGQYSGTAAAMRDTMGGAINALHTSWENLLESTGENKFGPWRNGLESIIKLLDSLSESTETSGVGWTVLSVKANQAIAGIAAHLSALFELVGADKMSAKFKHLFDEQIKVIKEQQKEIDKHVLKTALSQGKISTEQYISTVKSMAASGLLGVKEVADAMSLISKNAKGGIKPVSELTEAEATLGAQFAKTISTIREDIKYQQELNTLAGQRLSVADRFAEESRINEAYVYRIDLLRQQEQFGAKLGKQIADANKELRALKQSTDLKLKLTYQKPVGQVEQLRNGVIDLFGGIQQGVDVGMDRLLTRLHDLSLEAGRDILAGRNQDPITQANEEAFEDQRTGVREFWQDYSEEVRRGQQSISESIRAEMAKVKAAHESGVEGALNAAEMEIELNRLRQELIGNQLNAWAGLFSTLSNMFGGFGSQVISSVQNMIATAQQLQAIGAQIGGSAGSLVSSAGPFLAVVGEIYGAQRRSIARQRQQQYTSEAIIGFGDSGTEVFGRQGRAIANQLRDSLTNIFSILSRTLSVVPKIEIQAREDGKKFQLYVANQFIGLFSTLQEAIDAAVIAAAQHIGTSLSDTFRTILERTTAQTADELAEDLNFGKWYDELGIGTFGTQIRDLLFQFHKAMEDATRLGLSTQRIAEWFKDSVQSLKAEALGIDLSASEALRNLAGLAAGIKEVSEAERESIRQRMAAIQEQIDLATRMGEVGRGSGAGGGGAGRGGEGGGVTNREDGGESTPGGPPTKEISAASSEIERLREELARLAGDLGNVTDAISDTEISMGVFNTLYRYLEGDVKYAEQAHKYALMKVEIEFAAIKAQLIALGKWEEFAGMFDDALAAARQQAGEDIRRGGRAGGRGSSDRDSVRDFISDRRYELSLSGLTEYRRALKEIDRTYAEQLEKAGKDTKLRRELLSLKDQELAQLAREKGKRTQEDYTSFTRGSDSGFVAIRKTAEQLIADIKDSPFGDARRAKMISGVLEEMNQQINKLSKETALGILGDLAGDLEKYGVGAQQQSEIRRAMAMLEHQLAVENYRDRIEMLKAEGRVSQDIIDKMEAALGTISSVDINKWFGALDTGVRFKGYEDATVNFTGAVDSATTDLNKLAESFRSAKDSIRDLLSEINRGDLGIVSPEDAFNAAKSQYDDVIAKARRGELSGFEGTPEVTRNYIEALKKYSPELAARELPGIQSELTKLLGATTVRDQNLVYSEKFAANQTETNKILTTGLTSLSNTSLEQTEIQARMLDSINALNMSQQELNAKLSRLESAAYGAKRTAA